jgi:transcriptional regulator with XRE-family HTH domain
LNNLRAVRHAHGLTQIEFAKRAGVSRRTVRYAELGRPIRRATMRKLVLGLGIKFGWRHLVFPDEPIDQVLVPIAAQTTPDMEIQ